MTEDETPRKRDIVEKQLLELRSQHIHHIMVALGMSHPDLDNVVMHDNVIQNIDTALGYLRYYPKSGYTIKDEPSDSPKVFGWVQRFLPHRSRPAPEPAEEG